MASGNYLFLICEPCAKANESDFGFKLAKRDVIGGYAPFGPAAATRNFTEWLKRHKLCAGKDKPDHFQLGHLVERNSDQPIGRTVGRALKAVN